MEEKLKAKELVERFYEYMPFKDCKLTSCEEKPELIIKMERLSAKQCALIAVDEILLAYKNGKASSSHDTNYWESVKQEITNL